MRRWPRSIRWQLLASLLLLEVLSIGLFAIILVHRQNEEVHLRAQSRLAYESASLALQAREALAQQQTPWIAMSVKMMGEAPTVALARVTDTAGSTLFVSSADPAFSNLTSEERAQIPRLNGELPHLFISKGNQWESVAAIYTGSDLRGYAWITYSEVLAREQTQSLLDSTFLFGAIWIVASIVLVFLIARSISRPLAILHRGTSALMDSPENTGSFPLPVVVDNEIGDLIQTFNGMVASIAEQRMGLNDTLSLLDSMLANAPIGLAFFDRRLRFVRVNRVFAEMTGVQLSRHLGRTLPELLSQPLAQQLEDVVLRVFEDEEPIRNLELNNPGLNAQGVRHPRPWTWLVSTYPVRTHPQQVRWAGLIVMDASERKRNEEALRKTEKLAATGRLAASIAHEINNPLEAITNLLFLLRNYCNLADPAMNYVRMAENEASRVAEITQQTLRFYRQSTSPTRARMSELLDSVLGLHQGRLNTLNIRVERRYEADMDLFCFAGEVRQVFANLVGNATDACPNGGRIVVRARRSRNWKEPGENGVRFTVADTGCGMEPAVRERIFEAFFTTKEDTGTGLGLWVSQEILVKHRAIVHVRSRTEQPGKSSGTVFQIFIPDDPNLTASVPQPGSTGL